MFTVNTTEITTAALRIQRVINRTPAALRVWFDAEGNEIIAHENDLRHQDTSIYEGAVVSLQGGTITQREAQDALDWASEPEDIKSAISVKGYMEEKALLRSGW